MAASRGEPASAGEAFDGRRAPDTRRDQGPTRREVHHLPRADAPYGVHPGLDEEGERGVGTQAPIRHQHIPGCSGGVHLLHLGEIVGEEGRDHQLQEQARAGVEQSQPSRHGNAAPRPVLRRLTERLLEGRGIGHGTARAIDQQGAMPVPPPRI